MERDAALKLLRGGAEAIAQINSRSWAMPVLDGVDLRGVDLTGIDLVGRSLAKADLSGAILRDANLYLAGLTGACLTEADLRHADLYHSMLIHASLLRADLRGANLCPSRLFDTDFREAFFFDTWLGAIDLSEAQNLDTARHVGSSYIDAKTLHYSGGEIPTAFLEGCRVPDSLIAYSTTLRAEGVEADNDFYLCFVSYSHVDKAFAHRFHAELHARGIRCWLDEHELLPGDDIYKGVDRGIRLWDKVILRASKN
ncbi:MAG: toll/interleukin-1 receptor domain-containing protein [Pseudomonadota bacterium]